MTAYRELLIGGAVVLGLALAGCQTPKAQIVTPSQKSAVELRAMQGRMFETSDRAKTLRTVIATLQDLGYSIEKVEAGAGTVTARKLSQLQMTVSVFPRGGKQMIVRANAVVTTETSANQVDAPEFYQQLFFEPLSKALFLAANQDIGQEPPAPQASQPSAPGEPNDTTATPSPKEKAGTKS